MRPMEYLQDLETREIEKAVLTEALKHSGKPWKINKEDVILIIKLGYSMSGKQRWRSQISVLINFIGYNGHVLE